VRDNRRHALKKSLLASIIKSADASSEINHIKHILGDLLEVVIESESRFEKNITPSARPPKNNPLLSRTSVAASGSQTILSVLWTHTAQCAGDREKVTQGLQINIQIEVTERLQTLKQAVL